MAINSHDRPTKSQTKHNVFVFLCCCCPDGWVASSAIDCDYDYDLCETHRHTLTSTLTRYACDRMQLLFDFLYFAMQYAAAWMALRSTGWFSSVNVLWILSSDKNSFIYYIRLKISRITVWNLIGWPLHQHTHTFRTFEIGIRMRLAEVLCSSGSLCRSFSF